MLKETYKFFFGTLANINRLQIINVLREKDRSVTEICNETGFNQTTTSHNLKRLLKCGFIKVEKKGKKRIYSLNKKTTQPLMKIIDTHMNTYCKKILQEKKHG